MPRGLIDSVAQSFYVFTDIFVHLFYHWERSDKIFNYSEFIPYICQFLLYNFEALLSVVSPWWLSPFMFLKCPSLSLVICFILKSNYTMLIHPHQDFFFGRGLLFFFFFLLCAKMIHLFLYLSMSIFTMCLLLRAYCWMEVLFMGGTYWDGWLYDNHLSISILFIFIPFYLLKK